MAFNLAHGALDKENEIENLVHWDKWCFGYDDQCCF